MHCIFSIHEFETFIRNIYCENFHVHNGILVKKTSKEFLWTTYKLLRLARTYSSSYFFNFRKIWQKN
jgi:hypothetical protein